MGRDEKTLGLTELQLEVLVQTYITTHAYGESSLQPHVLRYAIASAALEKRGLIERYRTNTILHLRTTEKGSRLLTMKYPLEVITRIAMHVDPIGYRDALPWRTIQYMMLQVPPEQYPVLLTDRSPNIRELATEQWEKLNESENS